MARNPNDNNDALCDALFNDDWHRKIQNVIEFTMRKLDQAHIRYDRVIVAKKIIDYNIQKTLSEALSSMEVPEALDFSLIDYYQAFEEFHKVLDVFLAKNNTSVTVKIFFGSNDTVKKFIYILRDFIENDDKKLIITFNQIDNQNVNCTFTKI